MNAAPPGLARRDAGSLPRRFARLSSGKKVLALLTLVLLPLGFIQFAAALQTTRAADAERRALLGVAVNESARRLAADLAVDSAILRAGVNALAGGEPPALVCARIRAALAVSAPQVPLFAIAGPGGQPQCGPPDLALPRTDLLGNARPLDASIEGDGALTIAIEEPRGGRAGFRL